jgi:hypothetical protein
LQLRKRRILATSLFAITWIAAVALGTRGCLLFSGGITAARRHAGDNAGESAIVALLNNQTLVFGCSLVNHTRTEPTDYV